MEYQIMVVIVYVSLFVLIPILIGMYVYRDARMREMNAVLWTLIAILSPALVGFIIYLLVRGSYSDLKCPSCEATITEEYTACPKCGIKLKSTCSNCNFPMEPDWTTCPKCASPLPKNGNEHMIPIKKKDTALSKILFAVILIPVLILGLVTTLNLAGLDNFTTSKSSSSMTSANLSVDDYKDYPEIIAWINECDKDPYKVYALRYQIERGKETETHCLIYRPAANKTNDIDCGVVSGVFSKNIEVDFGESFDSAVEENKLTSISVYSYSSDGLKPGLKISVNDKKINIEITEVNYNPTISK